MIKKNTTVELQQAYYMLNGNLLKTEAFILEAWGGPAVYEVLRVIDGVPLFLEEHLERLNMSLELLNTSFRVDHKILKDQIHQLIAVNSYPQKNIKIIINNLESKKANVYLFFITSPYPEAKTYIDGVKTILYSAVRDNPNVKAIAQSQREQLNTAITSNNVYEAILMNERGEVTEGSRSNIFIVKGNKVYTAPASEVLIGVTRTRVINLCKKTNLPIVEANISVDFIKEAEGLFLTGTSPKVLPISMVDDMTFSSTSNSIILGLMKEYDNLIREYISNYHFDENKGM